MPTPLYPDDLGSDLSSMRAQLRAALVLARSSAAKTKIYAATLDLIGRLLIKAGGVLVVENAAGNGLMYVGQIGLSDGSTADGLAVFRPTGDVALAAFQSNAGFVTVVYDQGANHLVQADEVAGQGLARPYLVNALYPTRLADLLASTSATFETVYRGQWQKQHPRLTLSGRYAADTAGTAGELQVLVNGVQLGATFTMATFTQGTWTVGPGDVAGAYMALLDVEVQIRRTAGTGNVRAAPLMAEGIQA